MSELFGPGDGASQSVDWSSLCPYCDGELPEHPSTVLKELRTAVDARSQLHPNSGLSLNPLHRRTTPVTVSLSYCERHDFETTTLRVAEKSHWPADIDFNSLPRRLVEHCASFEELIEDPSSSDFYLDVLRSLERFSSGIAGDLASFEKTGTGYYGYAGKAVILWSLTEMLDLDIIDSIHSIPTPVFLERVLIPEAAVLLIQEDLGLTREQALATKEKSLSYGSILFPEDDTINPRDVRRIVRNLQVADF
ncbi:hypothetical protein BV25DRAFT_1816946 [Artomyces pyxidatus]|uniref:Uncharacterized protein n=1 Tax=Artomyces pyxidatus TaxID=48021 RepID=A0ACB8SF55_9AGAM|nr:hypothetical protein BV25DRAFT_1816946 [Artomyces pyxidatus]